MKRKLDHQLKRKRKRERERKFGTLVVDGVEGEPEIRQGVGTIIGGDVPAD